MKNIETLGTSDPAVECYLSNDSKKKIFETAEVSNNLNPDFNKSELIPLAIGERRYKTLKILFKVMDKNTTFDSHMSGISLELRDYLEKPGMWLNEYLPLRDNEGN